MNFPVAHQRQTGIKTFVMVLKQTTGDLTQQAVHNVSQGYEKLFNSNVISYYLEESTRRLLQKASFYICFFI